MLSAASQTSMAAADEKISAGLDKTLSDERQRLTQDMHRGLGSSQFSAVCIFESWRIGEADVAEVQKACIDDLKLAIDSMEPATSPCCWVASDVGVQPHMTGNWKRTRDLLKKKSLASVAK